MLALQRQKLKGTGRVKSIAPFSAHWRLGRHGNVSTDPNMGLRATKKEPELVVHSMNLVHLHNSFALTGVCSLKEH